MTLLDILRMNCSEVTIHMSNDDIAIWKLTARSGEQRVYVESGDLEIAAEKAIGSFLRAFKTTPTS